MLHANCTEVLSLSSREKKSHADGNRKRRRCVQLIDIGRFDPVDSGEALRFRLHAERRIDMRNNCSFADQDIPLMKSNMNGISGV